MNSSSSLQFSEMYISQKESCRNLSLFLRYSEIKQNPPFLWGRGGLGRVYKFDFSTSLNEILYIAGTWYYLHFTEEIVQKSLFVQEIFRNMTGIWPLWESRAGSDVQVAVFYRLE